MRSGSVGAAKRSGSLVRRSGTIAVGGFVDAGCHVTDGLAGRFCFGRFRLDTATRVLWMAEEVRPLSPKGFDLLCALVRNVDQVVSKATLLEEVWAGVTVDGSVLKVRIAEIRAALDESAAAPIHIQTHQRVGYRFAGPVEFQSLQPQGTLASSSPVTAFSRRPALAILAFDNFGRDPSDVYFVDGIVEELTTRLARFRYFPVIARNSSFVYKGTSVDVVHVSQALGARYVVEGSIQRAEDRVRIIVQLIDGQTGHHLWTERFESDLTDVFSLTDEITDRIAASLHSQLFAVEVRGIARRTFESADAWDCLLRAWSQQQTLDPDDNERAKREFARAIEYDSSCAQAHSGLAMCHFRDVVHGWSTDVLDSVRATQYHAGQSMRCDEQDPYSHLAMAVSHWITGKRDELFDAIEHAIWLNPSLAWAYLWGGIAYGVGGEPARALEMASQAIRLSPLDPLRGLFDYAAAVAHFAAGRYDLAYESAKQAAHLMPSWGWIHAISATSASWLGRDEEARASLAHARELLRGLRVEDLGRLLPFADPDFLERATQAARKADGQD